MKRNNAKNIKFSDSELIEIQKAADKIGISFAAFVRLACIEKANAVKQ